MSCVTIEQLQSFAEQYGTATTPEVKPVASTTEDGSYDLDKLAQLMEMWTKTNSWFQYEAGKTSCGPGFFVTCPGEREEGWPDGENHSEPSGGLSSATAVWVGASKHPNFACKHSHCDTGAAHGRKGWKALVAVLDRGEQKTLLFGAPTISTKTPISDSFVETDIAASPNPKYPIEIWDGTDYGEFVEICSRDNFIPREFLAEAIKTVTGSVLGAALSIPDIEGGIPRFYTVLMGGAGAGKGTSISWASSVFKNISLGGTAVANLLWSPATKIEDVPWAIIGACEEGFNSAPGMQRSNNNGQRRWLQTFEELDHMIEGSGIDGSGKALMGVNRQLYDREEFSTTTTGKRDAIAGKAQNTILSATTPEIWTDMFAGKSVRGSGLFQRFNLIVSDENRKKGSLRKPRLELFKSKFTDKIMSMDKNPIEVTVPDHLLPVMDEWFTQDRFSSPEIDGEVRGRLNVLAWRNALHLTWQRGLMAVGTRELHDAFRLSEYQFEMRLRHTPAEGENTWALVENKIRNFMRVEKKASRRDIVRKLSLHRYGGGTTDKALSALSASGEVKLFTVEGHGPKSTFAVWED